MEGSADIGLLFVSLIVLIGVSAFFSSSETAMMSLNRYRLRHLAKKNHPGATRSEALLKRPDRLIGGLLIGNNLANILATSIATALAIHAWGDAGIVIVTIVLSFVILIFAEVTPKTVAAFHPERVAFPASAVLVFVQKIFYPLVLLINAISNGILRLFGVRPDADKNIALNAEELKTMVNESGTFITSKRRGMLLGILDLENVTVNDILIPRNEIIGIDIESSMDDILKKIRFCNHTRIPIYNNDINNVIGVLHMRNVGHLLSFEQVDKARILKECDEPYFVPESTPLYTQLINFQIKKERIAIVVDEYGEVEGLITMEDILEEIVGDFTTDDADNNELSIKILESGDYLIDGTLTIREINKALKWSLPTGGPKTLSGLVTEILEEIPEVPVCLRYQHYYFETVRVKDNLVQLVKIRDTKKPYPVKF